MAQIIYYYFSGIPETRKAMERAVKKRMFFLLAFGLAAGGAAFLWGTDTGCVGCHTDEAVMQKLFVPAEAPASEGEG